MNKPEVTSKNTQAKKRAWVTPAFEQVPLKEALNSTPQSLAFDGSTDSS